MGDCYGIHFFDKDYVITADLQKPPYRKEVILTDFIEEKTNELERIPLVIENLGVFTTRPKHCKNSR